MLKLLFGAELQLTLFNNVTRYCVAALKEYTTEHTKITKDKQIGFSYM